MAPSNGVLVTKIVPIGPTLNLNLSTLPKLRPAPQISATAVLLKRGASSPTSSGYASSTNSNADEDSVTMATPTKAKKRRLDHLSWEEKVQRKKLKNRVAAQTSRDRKKARMEEMEYEIKELTDKTELLQNKCESLQNINESLLAKNQKLDTEMEQLRQELVEMKELAKKNSLSNNNSSNRSGVNADAEGCASTYTGSAASNADPLPQGILVDTQSSARALALKRLLQQQLKQTTTTASLWRIVALCLLYKTCCSSTMKSSMRDDSKSWPKAYSQISQQTWRQAMAHASKLLPKMQATQSDCLDQWWGPQQSAWNPTGIELMA
ncbi:GH20722 [Drosophila grimshawi]|uniref:X-box-binding protein 1 n=1 Tax=Drosophila grimshawi TaxID=7222 RepID=B4J6R2_DROGR|nr:GH20722 [Drosophila grimshawi]